MARRILLSRAGGGGISSVPFHPAPSVGHELGVMFGGIAAMVIGECLLLQRFWVFARRAVCLKGEPGRARAGNSSWRDFTNMYRRVTVLHMVALESEKRVG